MNDTESIIRGERRRQLVAYYKIALGMTIKECAFVMGIRNKTADWYWHVVKNQIRSSSKT